MFFIFYSGLCVIPHKSIVSQHRHSIRFTFPFFLGCRFQRRIRVDQGCHHCQRAWCRSSILWSVGSCGVSYCPPYTSEETTSDCVVQEGRTLSWWTRQVSWRTQRYLYDNVKTIFSIGYQYLSILLAMINFILAVITCTFSLAAFKAK